MQHSRLLPVDSPSPNFLNRTASELPNETAQRFTSGSVWVWEEAPQTNSSPWTEKRHGHKQLPPQHWLCKVRKITVVIHTNDCWQHKGKEENEVQYRTWSESLYFFSLCTFAVHRSVLFPSLSVAFEKKSTFFKSYVKLCSWEEVEGEDFDTRERHNGMKLWKDCLPVLSSFTLLPFISKSCTLQPHLSPPCGYGELVGIGFIRRTKEMYLNTLFYA